LESTLPIKVVVHGASGRMGQEVIKALCHDRGTQVVGAVENQVTADSLALPDNSGTVPFAADLEKIIVTCRPDVIVDFTIQKAAMPAVRIAARNRVHMVIGTTGFTSDNISEIEQLALSHQIGVVIAPNFALGAILMIHLSKIAAKYFDYAEIIELHHHQKADAPSGTALATARNMAQARGKPFYQPQPAPNKAYPSRGEATEGIGIHSVRLPGLMAHQEVIFGGPGQTLSIRHDTINRECYMPGVIMAVKEVVNRKGLIYGLENILGL